MECNRRGAVRGRTAVKCRRIAVLGALGATISVIVSCLSLNPAGIAIIEPAAALGPADVVEAQLDALRENTDENEGIATTFRFASPQNRDAIGSLESFIELFESPLYLPMLNHEEVQIFAPSVQGDLALVPVALRSKDNRRIDYLFILTRQRETPYDGMWMTDAVQIHSPNDPHSDGESAQMGHTQPGVADSE